MDYLLGRLTVETGDITALEVDAVVNAANSSLMGGGGVDGAIHRAGGSAILEACKALRTSSLPDGLPTGGAVATTAGNLHARYVIHTVGPVWRGGGFDEDRSLGNAYRESLKIATELRLSTIAFPAISTGVYGFPKDRAATIAFETIRDHLDANSLPERVRLVFFSAGDAEIFKRAVVQCR